MLAQRYPGTDCDNDGRNYLDSVEFERTLLNEDCMNEIGLDYIQS